VTSLSPLSRSGSPEAGRGGPAANAASDSAAASEETLTAALARSARLFPDRLALWARGETRTFAEFWDAAGTLAAALIAGGIRPNDRVAILSSRTVTAYTAIAAALRAAATYVPLNPRYPADRNRSILAASGARALIVDRRCAVQFADMLAAPPPDLAVVLAPERDTPRSAARTLFLAVDDLDAAAARRTAWPAPSPADRAYLLFTSGSTGAPKGVPITHANVGAYLAGVAAIAPVTPEDRLIQLVDLTFDLSAHDMFAAWTNGAAIVSVPENATPLAPRFVQELAVTQWLSVPSAIGIAHQAGILGEGSLPSLRASLFCGEAFPASLARLWARAAPNSAIHNLYGPTEATIAISHGPYRPDHPATVLPIGRPFAGQGMALFDDGGRPAAPGAVGEICLSGSQLTRGYWQQPGLDADKFLTVEGTRWYRTGDLGRMEAGDGLHFLGRVDHQIKIRGYRVETLEIEGALRAAAGRDLVAVLPLPAPEGGTAEGVVGFVAGAPLDTAAVLERLQGSLPDYMIPQALIVLDALPLNANGKVDLRALAGHPALADLRARSEGRRARRPAARPHASAASPLPPGTMTGTTS